MAVAFDAASDRGAFSTGNLSYTHTPVGTPRAVIAFHYGADGSTDNTTGMTYGGVAMTEVTNSPRLKSAVESIGLHVFFLGSGIPTGAQTIAVTTSSSYGANFSLSCMTLTAGADTQIAATAATISSNNQSNPSETLALGSATAFVLIAFVSGQNATSGISPSASWTSRSAVDVGQVSFGNYTRDSNGTGNITCGWTQTSDDALALSIGISEITNKTLAAASGSYAVTGTNATLRRNLPMIAGVGSYAFTGTAANTKLGRNTAAAAGSYLLTGTAASLLEARKLAAAAGSYAFTGTDANLNKGQTLAAGAGSYLLTGTAANPLLAHKLAAAAGSYLFTGTAANTKLGRNTAALAGAYAFTGTAASLLEARKLVAAAGSYVFTGTAATPFQARKVIAALGQYNFVGTDADVHIVAPGAYLIIADAGAYLMTGTAATPLHNWKVQALGAAYVFTGTGATPTIGAAGGGSGIVQQQHRISLTVSRIGL